MRAASRARHIALRTPQATKGARCRHLCVDTGALVAPQSLGSLGRFLAVPRSWSGTSSRNRTRLMALVFPRATPVAARAATWNLRACSTATSSSYYAKFGLVPANIKSRHEIPKSGPAAPAKKRVPARKKPSPV